RLPRLCAAHLAASAAVAGDHGRVAARAAAAGDLLYAVGRSSSAALRDFARADPHRSIVARVRPWAKTAVLRTWTVPSGEADPAAPGPTALDPAALWEQAETRIASATR